MKKSKESERHIQRHKPRIRQSPSSQYYIEDTLLLQFLIARYTEMLKTEDSPDPDPVWAGLGTVALSQNLELAHAFRTLISSDSYTSEEVLTTSIDLFVAELARLETVDVTDYVEKQVERRLLTRGTARKFRFWSWREGRKMKKEQDFRFYAVWELISWLAISDEYLTAFEDRCRFSESSTQKKLEEGHQIVKAAIYKRTIDEPFFQPDMPTHTTN
jgi:hypothetical protein